MRTRRDFLDNYSTIVKPRFSSRKTRSFDSEKLDSPRPKRAKTTPDSSIIPDFLDALPDDLLLCILTKLSSSSSSPSDFVNVLLTCKRLKELALNSMVLSKASSKIFAIKAENWCESAHKFIKLCSDSGNADASYTLGMIRFYCLQNRGSGASLMAKAAINSHAQALYSLAVIQFNGSGGTKTDKDLRAGVSLCARAAFLGHVDAIRELGHCLQDGYGVRQNVTEGRRFLIQANARELSAAVGSSSKLTCVGDPGQEGYRETVSCKKSMELECYLPLLSDFGCDVPGQEAHPVNGFLSGWWSDRVVGSGLRMCSYDGCGRPETRRCEFRRCSVCGSVAYCSRACQAMDWKVRHKVECGCVARWVEGGGDGGGETTEVVVVDDGES